MCSVTGRRRLVIGRRRLVIGHWCLVIGHSRLASWVSALAVAIVLLGLAGCSRGPRMYPVHGKVTWDNGTEAKELAGGLVICESVEGKVGARGDIEPDGSFQLSTYKSGDGLLAGKHRVAVVEYSPKEPPPPPKVDRAFSSVEGSGLEINVERPTSDIVLKVRHAPPRPRR